MCQLHRKPLIGFLIGLLAIFSVSCDSQLEEEPDFINSETFFKDAQSLETAVNGAYQNLNGDRWFRFFYDRFVFEELAGYQVGWEKGPLDFQNGNVSPTDQYIEAYWNLSYEAINRANTVVAQAQRLEGEVGNEALRQRVLAEAKFLRSFYYFNLIRYFDDVPFKVKPAEQLSFPSNEDGERKVLDMMFADLQDAAEVLPSQYDGDDAGRATKWAAKTLLMKAYLKDEQWTQARGAAEDIITNSPHRLYDDFGRNFSIADENDPDGERIFEIQVSASADAGENSNTHAHYVPPDHEFGQGWHWLWTTKQYRMRYDEDDRRIPGTFLQSYKSVRPQGASAENLATVNWSPDAEFSLGRFNGVVDENADADNSDELIYSGGWSRKRVEDCGGRNCWASTEKNIVMLRFADVLLGHTEASLEGGGGGQFDKYFGINRVRERAGLSTLSGLSTEALRDSLVNEYMLEFTFENKSYSFLRRKSTFNGDPDPLGEQIQRFIDNHDVDRQVKQRDYALPIPPEEVRGNENVQQHPFWR